MGEEEEMVEGRSQESGFDGAERGFQVYREEPPRRGLRGEAINWTERFVEVRRAGGEWVVIWEGTAGTATRHATTWRGKEPDFEFLSRRVDESQVGSRAPAKLYARLRIGAPLLCEDPHHRFSVVVSGKLVCTECKRPVAKAR